MTCQYRYEVTQIKTGYALLQSGEQIANCSVTLVKERTGPLTVLVDTAGPWSKDSLLQALHDNGTSADDVTHVIGTHGHSDHIGNLNLFPGATFIVSYDISQGDKYSDNNLANGEAFSIAEGLRVMPTPGHTSNDVSLVVEGSQLGTVVVAGDLFENEGDLEDPQIWKEVSENPQKQQQNRAKVLTFADYIVPGHGKMFKVTESMRCNDKTT